MEKTTTKKPVSAGIIAMVIIIILAVGAIAIVSTPKPSPTPYYITQTLQRTTTPQLYVKLRVEAHEVGYHWERDSSTDLPCYVTTISYMVSNDGTAYADNVGVTVALDGGLVRSISISISSQSYQTGDIQFTFKYDTSHTVLVKASSPTSKDETTLTINAKFPRYFVTEGAELYVELYITPNDSVVKDVLNFIS